MLFMHSVKLWTAVAEILFSLRRVISSLYIEDFDFFCCDKKYTYVYVYVIKSIVQKVLVSVLAILFCEVLVLVSVILFETSIGIGIANTFKKYC